MRHCFLLRSFTGALAVGPGTQSPRPLPSAAPPIRLLASLSRGAHCFGLRRPPDSGVAGQATSLRLWHARLTAAVLGSTSPWFTTSWHRRLTLHSSRRRSTARLNSGVRPYGQTSMVTWQKAYELALSLPEAEERDHFGSPSFRVRGKIFAQLSGKGSSSNQALVKLSPSDQTALTMSASDCFSSVPHWGRHGWTYVQLAKVDSALLHSLLLQSWRLIAPKSLVIAANGRKV